MLPYLQLKNFLSNFKNVLLNLLSWGWGKKDISNHYRLLISVTVRLQLHHLQSLLAIENNNNNVL